MLAFILRRIAGMIPLLIGITIICFAVIHLAPGDPAQFLSSMNPKFSESAYEKFEKMYGLDKPLPVRYLDWVKRVAVLDFGESFAPDGRSVMDKVGERMPVTIYLNIAGLVLIFIVALPLGVLSAYWHNTFFDKSVTVFVFAGFAVPTFWLALICMYYFGVVKGWLPISGLKSYNYEQFSTMGKVWDVLHHAFLPVVLSVFGGLAGLSRFARNSMMEVLGEEYIISARARGITEGKVIFKHALKNAMLPVVTILGLSIPGLIGGSVIFESIFSIPGMGQLFYQSVMSRDYPVVMGVLVLGAVLTLIGNLVADISYGMVDPRIRYGKK
ncbi:binding-protein-dependent transport systems inner membrane component [Denitrovibrio acetiphilus DSM 12809]|uniref:Binding-protein-dependent transport systems inner membrane component n=1 Tax=Denitrovibrio acetiphilus (strain DSM 12809 / NBRC 114555 / N2460) TaxID=522772 RepID=D4H727_DENA2|nr:ABC transporter permease [Denitrovibrio acetiphilus]ADD69731.1 binding-protein-dependent transport systems inner membrane component [Denitrovibrio acetiphilus DSM 12809]